MIKFLKTKLTSALILAGLMTCPNAFGQIVNTNINTATKPATIYYDGFNDVSSDGEPWYRVDIYYTSGDFWADPICHGFNSPDVPHTEVVTDPSIVLAAYTNMAFDQEVNLYLSMWEDDNGEECNYNADGDNPDDDFFEGYAAFTECCSTPFATSDSKPSRWFTNHNTATGGWLLPDSDEWDFQLATTWRFTAGSSCDDPLIFAALNAGEIRYNFNSNDRSIEGTHPYGGNIFSYENVADNPSADVYYSFTITEELKVTISTDNDATNFDTYIRLYNEGCGAMIAEDDDSGVDNTSIIETILTAGTYMIQVEGYEGNEGDFDLSISAGGPVSGTEELEIVPPSVKVFPNPANDFVQIDLRNEFSSGSTIEVLDLLGKRVYFATVSNEQVVQLDLDTLKAGTYLINVSDGEKTVTEKLILQ
ncbi:MAG: hypothetical protein ACI8ZM_001985 [Crocinitomix sp.]|jgi:hypothetical protein